MHWLTLPIHQLFNEQWSSTRDALAQFRTLLELANRLRPSGAGSPYAGSLAAGNTRAFRLARVLLFVMLFGAPLVFGAVQPWAWVMLAVICFLALSLWAVGCVQQGQLRVSWSPLYLPGLAFLLLGLVQYSGRLTFDRIGTRESLLKLAVDLLFFFLALQLVGSAPERTRQWVGLAVVIYAFLLSLEAIIQHFSSPDQIYWEVNVTPGGWNFGPYVNDNHYAGLMEMLIPLAAAHWLARRRTDPWRPVLGFALLVPIVSLLLCASRGGLIALALECGVLLVVLFKLARAPGRRSIRPAVVLAAIALVVLGFMWVDPGDSSTRLQTLLRPSLAKEVGFGNRKTVALDSLGIVRDHPWLGTGLGSFKTVYGQYQSFPDDSLWDHAHNDYAEVLAETGIIGGGLTVLAILLFLNLSFRGLLDRLAQGSGWNGLGCHAWLLRPARSQFFRLQSPSPCQRLVVRFLLGLGDQQWAFGQGSKLTSRY